MPAHEDVLPLVWGLHRCFLASVCAMNMFAVAFLSLQHYFAKKALWCVDNEKEGYDGMDTDTQIMFVKLTAPKRRWAITSVVVSVPNFAIALTLSECKCESSPCTAMELMPACVMGLAAIIILYALKFQHMIFKQEMEKTHEWLAAKTDAHKYIMQTNPALEYEQMNDIIHQMKLVKVKTGEAVYKQGSKDVDAMYLVRHGSIDVSIQGYPTYTCHRGSFFGELELNQSDQADTTLVRLGTARASLIEEKGIDIEEVELWEISRAVYRKELMKIMMNKRREYAGFLKKHTRKGAVASLFKDENGVQISEIELCMVASALEPVEFKDGEVVMREGETTNDLFMVVSGKADISTSALGFLHTELEGDFFGEIALVTDQPRSATVTANGVLKCAKLTRERFLATEGQLDKTFKRRAAESAQDLLLKLNAGTDRKAKPDPWTYEDDAFNLLGRQVSFIFIYYLWRI